AEGEPCAGETWKRALETGVDALAESLERRRVETLARRDEPVALGLPPRLQLVAGHARQDARARRIEGVSMNGWRRSPGSEAADCSRWPSASARWRSASAEWPRALR